MLKKVTRFRSLILVLAYSDLESDTTSESRSLSIFASTPIHTTYREQLGEKRRERVDDLWLLALQRRLGNIDSGEGIVLKFSRSTIDDR